MAPAAIAGAMKRAPSALLPAMATKTSPRLTARLSAVTPPTSRSAWGESRSASGGKISRSFISSFLVARSTMRPRPYLLSFIEASICWSAGGKSRRGSMPRSGAIRATTAPPVGRQHRDEIGEHPGLGIAAEHDLVGGAGLAADIIAGDVSLGRGALLDIEPHQIAHHGAGLGLDDAMAERLGLGLGALEERRRDQDAAVHQGADTHHG